MYHFNLRLRHLLQLDPWSGEGRVTPTGMTLLSWMPASDTIGQNLSYGALQKDLSPLSLVHIMRQVTEQLHNSLIYVSAPLLCGFQALVKLGSWLLPTNSC